MKWNQTIYQITEYKTMVTRMLTELRERIDELNENFSKETVSIKKGERIHKKQK